MAALDDLEPIFQSAGREWNVDPTLLKAVAKQESGGQSLPENPQGAAGIMQLRGPTAIDMGVTDRMDATQSIYGGAKYLSQMLDKYKTPRRALAAYNAGPSKLDDILAGKTALPDETAAYVPAVEAHYAKFSGAAKTAPAAAPPKAVESTADFLKRTSAPAAPAESNEAFLARTGGAPAPATPTGTALQAVTTGADAMGLPGVTDANLAVPPPTTPAVLSPVAAAQRVGGNVINAAREGFGSEPLGMGPGLTNRLSAYPGMVPLLAPMATAGDAALRGMGAVFRGGQELLSSGGAALGAPQLGRDLAAMPEAFMGSPGGMAAPEAAANRLATPMFDRSMKPRISVTADSSPSVAPALEAPAAGIGPRSLGAAATPAEMTPMGGREAAAARATGETQRLLEPAKPGVDTTQYVPGVSPTEAEYAGNAGISAKQKVTAQAAPEHLRIQQEANNQARVDHFNDSAGTPTIVNRMIEDRATQAQRDIDAAFGNKKPTDAAPVAQTIQSILTNPRDSENSAVQQYVRPLLSRLVDDTGALKSDPEQLYGLREDVARMMSKSAKAETPTLNHVTGQLSQIKDALDGVIEQGAPGYKQYLQNFATASRPIDEMQVLQDRSPVNALNGRITPAKYSQMMKSIVDDRQAGGVNPAKSISDDTMNRLFNIHSDLKRMGNLDLGKPNGSDTFMNFMHGTANGVVHAGLAASGIPGANIALEMGKRAMAGRNQAKQMRNMLNPDPVKYPPQALDIH